MPGGYPIADLVQGGSWKTVDHDEGSGPLAGIPVAFGLRRFRVYLPVLGSESLQDTIHPFKERNEEYGTLFPTQIKRPGC